MTRKNQRRNTSRELALFADCNRAETDRIDSLLTRVEVPAGEILLREGDHDRQFMIIVDGHASVTSGAGSHQRAVADVGPGSFVGEISLLDHGPRTATVTAVTPVIVYACNEREFDAILELAPSVGSKIARIASERRELLAAAA